jgi:trehalose synthase
MQEVDVQALDVARLEALIGPERATRFQEVARTAREMLTGRRVINVNSTATGGGVAELLQTLLAYARGVGIDVRWAVIKGDPPFFAITKRLHNHLYGTAGDGGPLGASEREHYERVLASNSSDLVTTIRPGDLVVLHDPQTAGLVDDVRAAGAKVVWRCHIGRDEPNGYTDAGWSFLRRYIEGVDEFVFTREQFAPPWVSRDRLHVITPSIDPFCAKNEVLSVPIAHGILQYVGLLGGNGHAPVPVYARPDGSPGRVDRRVDVLQTGPPPPPDAPLVAQLSRWDRMKDMVGVLEAFADHVPWALGAHLSLVGPAVHAVSDDPEAAEVLDECVERWRALPQLMRSRVHLACVPMHDTDEAAVIVNALQRHATVVTQKSIAEGFGLTVVEAMWKHRPVVASRVGGIPDQIVHGEHGLLVDDPEDLETFASAIESLLADPSGAQAMGERAYERAHRDFLGDTHLERWGAVFTGLARS